MDVAELRRIVAAGESAAVEFKKSTAQLPRAGETLCGLLNAAGGVVVIGVSPDGELVGQEVSDRSHQEIARMLDRFDPPAPVETEVVAIPESARAAIVLRAPRTADGRPFVYDGRPYQRVGTSTSRMPQERYEALLLERAHVRRRWENQTAVGVRLEDLDHEEIQRTREFAIQHRRISAGTSTDIGDILDRLGLRRDGELTQAAQILYGTRFLPDALREVVLNAVMHRDYSRPGGHVAIAVFDDRVEIRSTGILPAGVTPDMLSGPHPRCCGTCSSPRPSTAPAPSRRGAGVPTG